MTKTIGWLSAIGLLTFASATWAGQATPVMFAGTGHFYTTTKNKRTTPDKMELKKFDPVARKHVAFKEHKIK